MPSLEGLSTWFDYQLLLTALAVAFLVALRAADLLAAWLGRLPLASPAFGLAVSVAGLGAVAVLIWVAGRFE